MTLELKDLFEVNEGLNEQMVYIILNTIKENHESGMDYLKFKQSIQSLKNMGMDEATSIKSAFVTASTMGLNKETLTKSIQNYINIVDKERDKFINTLKNQITANIDKPNEEIVKINQTIVDHQRKIEQLQQEIEAYNQKKDGIAKEVTASQEKIDKTKADFLAVYEAFLKNLNDDKTYFEGQL